jgi:hypothetical protein
MMNPPIVGQAAGRVYRGQSRRQCIRIWSIIFVQGFYLIFKHKTLVLFQACFLKDTDTECLSVPRLHLHLNLNLSRA